MYISALICSKDSFQALDIEAGVVKAKRYKNIDDLFADNDAEIAAEEDE